jgi:hypothetical protein
VIRPVRRPIFLDSPVVTSSCPYPGNSTPRFDGRVERERSGPSYFKVVVTKLK